MIPFMTEEIYQNLVRSVDKDAIESIHLCDFPKVEEAWINKELEDDMEELLKIVVLGRDSKEILQISRTVSRLVQCISKLTKKWVSSIQISLQMS